MDKEFLYEVLYGVFEKDAEHFLSFIETECSYLMFCRSDSEKEILKAEINKQLEYVFNKIKEDASDAPSKYVELLIIAKDLFKD